MGDNNLLAEFGYYLESCKLSKNTRLSYISDLTIFFNFIGKAGSGNLMFDASLFKQQAEDFFKYLEEKGYDNNSIHRFQASLKKFAKFLKLKGKLKLDEELFIGSVKPKVKLPTVLSEDTINKFLDNFKPTDSERFCYRNQAILELLYSSGLRVSELTNLRFSDVYLSNNFLRCKGKGDKERIIPISQKAVEAIMEYLKRERGKIKKAQSTDFLFVSQKGSKLNRSSVWNILKYEARKRGLSCKVYPHLLRHCFATHLLEHDLDLIYIKDLLGHANINTTQIYTAVSNKKLKETFKKFHPRA